MDLNSLPSSPGVYLFKDSGGKVLYVGKAKQLKKRVKQYFLEQDSRAMVPFLIEKTASIETIVVSSEKEALLLENRLIKQYQPHYNALLKDDKTFLSIAINTQHPWPCIRLIRAKQENLSNVCFGPYPNGSMAKHSFEVLQRLFPLRQCSDHELERRTRPCVLYDMKQCLAPCVGKCSTQEYQAMVHRVVRFLKGEEGGILDEIKHSMEEAAQRLEFEKAATLLKTWHSLETILKKPIKNSSSSIDVIGFGEKNRMSVVCVLEYRQGYIANKHAFSFVDSIESSQELLSSFILQFYPLDAKITVVVREPLPAQRTLQQVYKNLKIKVATTKKEVEAISLAEKNAQQELIQKAGETTASTILLQFQEQLKLTRYPETIECIDCSHLSGSNPVAAQVIFKEGKKTGVKQYHLHTEDGADDYAGFKEVLQRRFKNAPYPDVLLLDGGLNHLKVAAMVLQEYNIVTCDLVAISKEKSKHTKGLTQEKLHTADSTITLAPTSPLLLFLQSIRDETHRIALNFQTKQRSKQFRSALLDIPGIGVLKQRKLLIAFKSIKRLKQATKEELSAVEGISKANVEAILRWQRA